MKKQVKIKQFILGILAFALVMSASTSSYAGWCKCCNCICPWFLNCCKKPSTKSMIKSAFDQYRSTFVMNSYYKDQFEDKGAMPLTDDVRNLWMGSAMMVGSFLDGYTENAALAQLQSANANSMRDHAVSDSICKFGTLSRSLAATEAKMNVQQTVMSEIGLSRNLGTQFNIASTGRGRDNQSRLFSFVSYYCDTSDNNRGLGSICKASTSPTAPRDVEYNRDIDFTRTIEEKGTLNINLTDSTLTRDENAVVSLGNFLYGHRQDTDRISPSALSEVKGSAARYALVRSITARRAAAQNTYNAIVAMKSGGSGQSKAYMQKVLERLGLPSDDISKYLNGKYLGTPKAGYDKEQDPSYYAQMEILTKRLYQDPAFYANLMDTKANVKRISASLEAMDLAQTRDIYKSVSRSEMLMALLLELENRAHGEKVEANLSTEIKQR
jgi:hypothetical protein